MSDPNRAAYRSGGRGGHVESWFVRLNEPNGRRALWLKWTIFADGTTPPRSECWAVAFERGRSPHGGKRSFTLDANAVRDEPFRLAFDGNSFDGAHAEGRVQTASTDIVFAFDLEAALPPLVAYPFAWMYRARLPEFKTLTPIPDASAKGFYVVDGERVDVTGWRAMQGHNWGARHTHRYAWCHGFAFEGAPDVVFEGFSGRLKKGIELPWLSVAHLWADGQWHRFDAPREIASARADAGVMRWTLTTRAGDTVLEAEASADPRETAALIYANPGAAATNCLNSKLGSLRVTLRESGGRVRSWQTRQAALEVGWPSADHGVVVVA